MRNPTNTNRGKRSFRSWLRVTAVLAFMFFILSFMAHTLSQNVEAAGPPVVDGLFYKNDDDEVYALYDISEGGSGLYVYFDNPRIYVALVVDRNVNDNVCSPQTNTAYTSNAGWGGHRTCKRGTDSEYASFTLRCVSSPQSWSWQQGYTFNSGGTWVSNNTQGAGIGVAPPGYVSGSSMAWNFNNYINNYPPPVPWDMYQGGGPTTPIENWKTPYLASSPNTVVGLQGYPPAPNKINYSSDFEWEWAMVYEWSADLTICGDQPIFVLAGDSHHSPIKSGPDENDDFPEDPNPKPLMDFGDLPDSYSTLESSDGARNILTINSAFLGTSPDAELDGQPSGDASGDIVSKNDEDGVTRTGTTNWAPGNTVQLNLNVQGTTATGNADVGIWIDWNGDGDFDEANEFYSFLNLPTGVVSTVNVLIPANYSAGSSVYVRARIFNDVTNAPGGNLDAADYAGSGSTGEVEDYQWFFGPTAITLINSTTSSQEGGLMLVLVLTVLALGVTMFILRRRQMVA